jgi:hypothetical protein
MNTQESLTLEEVQAQLAARERELEEIHFVHRINTRSLLREQRRRLAEEVEGSGIVAAAQRILRGDL